MAFLKEEACELSKRSDSTFRTASAGALLFVDSSGLRQNGRQSLLLVGNGRNRTNRYIGGLQHASERINEFYLFGKGNKLLISCESLKTLMDGEVKSNKMWIREKKKIMFGRGQRRVHSRTFSESYYLSQPEGS